MKVRLFIGTFLILLSNVCMNAREVTPTKFNDETLHYVISYKWGLIHKDAGEAILSLRNRGDKLNLQLIGKTKSWADKFFEVRDTLSGVIAAKGFEPLSYTKIAHEGGKFSKDVITYTRSRNVVKGSCLRIREKDGKTTSSEKTLTATGEVYDMLSIFYYLRNIDYQSLANGDIIKTTVFSGNKSETLSIRSLGKTTVTTRDKQKREAYHIKFKFTTDGKKKSSDDIDCWISADSRHIPLLLIGKLPIGQVKCYYVG